MGLNEIEDLIDSGYLSPTVFRRQSKAEGQNGVVTQSVKDFPLVLIYITITTSIP